MKGMKGAGKCEHERKYKIYFAVFNIFEIHMTLKQKW